MIIKTKMWILVKLDLYIIRIIPVSEKVKCCNYKNQDKGNNTSSNKSDKSNTVFFCFGHTW